MTADPPDEPQEKASQRKPRLGEQGRQRQLDRNEKMAEALRANLRRRKEQARARKSDGEKT